MARSELVFVSPTTSHHCSSLRPGYLHNKTSIKHVQVHVMILIGLLQGHLLWPIKASQDLPDASILAPREPPVGSWTGTGTPTPFAKAFHFKEKL